MSLAADERENRVRKELVQEKSNYMSQEECVTRHGATRRLQDTWPPTRFATKKETLKLSRLRARRLYADLLQPPTPTL